MWYIGFQIGNFEFILKVKFMFEKGLTENQERQIKILLERNQFLQDAPLLDKDFITEADAEEIDEWINTVR